MTTENLANEHKVGKATIERDAKFAQSIDLIGEILGDDARQEILTRDAMLTKKDVTTLAKEEVETQAKIFEPIIGAKRRLRYEAAIAQKKFGDWFRCRE